MNYQKLSKLTNDQLIIESKKLKSNTIITAVLIGFIIGIAIYSVMVNGLGFFALIPLFLAYKMAKNSTKKEDIEKLFKERNII